MKIDLFVVEHGNKLFAYEPETLENAEYSPVEGSRVEVPDQVGVFKEIYQKGYGQTLSGEWHWIQTKEEWLDGDNDKVESAITDKRPPFTRNGERWKSQVVEKGVTSWSLHGLKPCYLPTEAGLATMHYKFSTTIKNLVVVELYGDNDDPLFLTPSSQS